ncbi:MAG: flagellar biosynthesis protein FlhF [Rhodoferax sp.]
MNLQRFTAPTAREALAKARAVFGDETLILSNRQTDQGVEVVATAETALDSLAATPRQQPVRAGARSFSQELGSAVEEDANKLAMSTLSFQDYVRERMMRRRHESTQQMLPQGLGDDGPGAAPAARPARAPQIAAPAPVKPVRAPQRAPEGAAQTQTQELMRELQAMKGLIEDRFNTLTWLGQARQSPLQSNLLLKLIRAGYSPALARTILERLPENLDAQAAVRWVIEVLERNVRTDAQRLTLEHEGGVFALIGSTGVGKTTTAAKLAGLCARVHGPASVGLITLDTYRVGAHEQLRAFGKMLGVVAHLAHDRAAVQDLLGLLANKKMVLIDTSGLAPHDPRKDDMMQSLDLPGVKRLLVLNASAHGDTLDDVVGSFKTSGAQQVILSKIDEAVKTAPALDAVIRHQLMVRGVTTGQRVPEDWEAANAAKLVRQSLRSAPQAAFDPTPQDLSFFFGQASAGRADGLDGGAAHA